MYFDININAWVVISSNVFEPNLNQMVKLVLVLFVRV